LTMIDRTLGPQGDNPHDQEAAIERFALTCGTDVKHGKQVAKLAGMMLSQLIGTHELTTEDRPLLEAAARLQDVGYLINYDQHHKHSYHLILNSRLAGFKPGDLEIIANVARYHRGSLPKKKHSGYGRLSKADRKRVKKLAGILRIAGGLDRSNSQNVQGVQVVEHEGKIMLRVVAQTNPEVDIWAADRRTELFEEAFGAKVEIAWADPNMPEEPANAAAHEAAAAERASADAQPEESASTSVEAVVGDESAAADDSASLVDSDNSSPSASAQDDDAELSSISESAESVAAPNSNKSDEKSRRRRDAKSRKPSKAK
ncbi:MAG: HD domain-containing protein, partial [Planctomycetales bacterium]|nr:HD domain-containing protein [Planctomycetales bacterium]